MILLCKNTACATLVSKGFMPRVTYCMRCDAEPSVRLRCLWHLFWLAATRSVHPQITPQPREIWRPSDLYLWQSRPQGHALADLFVGDML